MSGLSNHLHSGRFVPPLGCGGPRLEDRGFVEPELWSRELGLHEGFKDFSNNEVALVSPEQFPPSSPSALSNGLHPQGRLELGAGRHRQRDNRLTQTLINMQTHMELNVHAQAPHMDVSSLLASEHSRTSSQPLSLTVPPGPNNQLAAPVSNTEIDSTFCPSESSPVPVEGEKKYALRSSGRPRFPCHLRKSTRLRRSSDNADKSTGPEREAEGSRATEEKIWPVKHEETTVVQKEEQPKAVVPTALCPTDIPLALTVPKPVSKPGPRLGQRPGPKSRCRPITKPIHKAAPKSVLRQRQAAQALAMARAATQVPFTSPCPAPRASSETPINGRRRGRFTGVRRIVVKVARIPVSLSRRQKSYKISNLDTLSVTEKTSEGSVEGSDAVREPTALLRMKNNGKSVMVMFPPGEMPVILKRRRGRPPKQPPPGLPGDPLPNPGTLAADPGSTDLKKPRRRRRTKLPCPFPSYVNDTNDVKSEYGDVLSKLAFLNRQPPATGRCSPPRCWTPSEPESFHTPMENPGISTLLHRLTGCRRPRGSRGMGRGGGMGRGSGVGGGIGGIEHSQSTFSDFFESIGKKRKQSLSEPGPPRKRGKGGHGRGGGVVGTEPGGEKPVRKRRMRKNGTFKGETLSMGQDWLNGAEGWGEEFDKVKSGYQFCGPSRGGFSSCEYGRGTFSGPGGGRGGAAAGEDQSLFAGYFRSLLDSDDSSDLLDMSSSQSDPSKSQCNSSYEGSSLSMNPGFPKWTSKSTGGEGASQGHNSRPSYSYGSPAQMSPTRSSYPKSTPPSLSHSPSSLNTSSYGHYSGYSSSSPAGLSQRSPDCSFAYGKNTAAGYSNYQTGPKRGFGGYHSSTGPNSPGGGYMSVAKGGSFNPSPPDSFKQYNSSQWSYRQTCGPWSDGFGSQFHGFNEYGSNESKDILDISNYTPQKAKRLPFPESLSESSSDSSHLSSAAPGAPPSSGTHRHSEASHLNMSGDGGQSSLSSLEKLMMDWHESATGPSYNWSQNVLFQGGGTSKPGRGRRKRTEMHMDKEGSSGLHSHSPSGSSPTPAPRRGVGRGRGSRGGRGGLSPCQRSGAKGRGKAQLAATGNSLGGTSGPLEGSALCLEALDYYSGDSSSLSPLATPNPPPPSSYLQDPCEYTSPYSAHPSTPSSEERYPALYPAESSSSLSPSVSSPPYPPKPTPPPPQAYLPRTFSPSCSPSQRITPHCGSALSPSHRPPAKEQQFSQYDSPSYCSSPYWYGQPHNGSPSPQMHNTHSNTAIHAHNNPHTSPHGATQGNVHDPQHHNNNFSSHMSASPSLQHQSNPLSHSLPQNQPNAHLSPHSNPSLHSTGLYKERSPPSGMAPHTISTGHRPGAMALSPYPKPSLDSSPHQEDTSGYSMSQPSYQGMGQRYASQGPPGGGVLCQLLDQASEDSFSVTSL